MNPSKQKTLDESKPGGEMILYQTEDSQTRVQVRLDGQTAWLTQAQMAELFQTTQQNVSLHIQNIYAEGELTPEATHKESLSVQPTPTVKEFSIVRQEGGRQVSRSVAHYNLDVIIAVGYRVKSARGTQFRQWATQRLKEYLVTGFALNEEKLKQEPEYFERLLAKIRDIRSSEKVFWRKVLDIYATSADYDANEAVSQKFFATVQNKMHWAAHGHTAAEVVHARADASRPFMGLKTTLPGGVVRKEDASVAKNYLAEAELEALNRIVMAYLEFAEVQAMNRKPMTMRNWIAKLDDFLRLSDREILSHAGKISHDAAVAKAELEFSRFRAIEDAKPSTVEKDFEAAVKKLNPLPPAKPKTVAKKEKPHA
jgi:hypothetical protein